MMEQAEWEAEMECFHAKMRANKETMDRLKAINGPLASTVSRRMDEIEKETDDLLARAFMVAFVVVGLIGVVCGVLMAGLAP